jgi:allantoicase
VMGEGWETARRRDSGNDWMIIELAAPGVPWLAELDTTHFKGNAPGWAKLTGRSAGAWAEVLPRTRLQPDTRHRFRIEEPREISHLRLDIYPDGGMARLRLFGALTETGRNALSQRFLDTSG